MILGMIVDGVGNQEKRGEGVTCKRPWERNGLNVWFPKNRHFVSGKVVSVLEPQRHPQDLGSQSSFCGDS